MTAHEVTEPPEGAEWGYEIKLDGYRGLAIKHGDSIKLLSRKNNNLATDFPDVVKALRAVRAQSALIDGEVVALDSDGKPSFQLLQNRSSSTGTIVYYAFDLLSLDGEDLRLRPLRERKMRLAEILQGTGVRYSQTFDGPPGPLIEQIQRLGLEGIVAKQKDSVYEPGERSGAWRKFKLSPAQEFVIGGFKPGDPLESLVVGYYEGDKLLCAGKVRQGLNAHVRAELANVLRPLRTKTCPFANLPTVKKGRWGEGISAKQMDELCWVEPTAVVQISFTQWTKGGNLRHGTYQGLRVDKDAREVNRESAR
jgi:bifunctional non-homologous end joining protein LigD